MLGVKFQSDDPDNFRQPPYVFRVPGVLGVCYERHLSVTVGGARVVVESYVLQDGKARLIGRGGKEMDQYSLDAVQVYNPRSNSTSVLTHGVLEWSSGHELPSRAVIYEVSPEGVKALWKLTSPGIRVIGTDNMMFAISYHDEQRHYKNLPDTAIDVYSVDTGIPQRLVHEFPGLK